MAIRSDRRNFLIGSAVVSSVGLCGCTTPDEDPKSTNTSTDDTNSTTPEANCSVELNTDWPSFGANQLNNWHTPSDSPVSSEGDVRWTEKLAGQARSMPVIADGHVFVTNLTGNDDMPGQITAIDGHCGTTEWTADLSATVLSTPAVHDGILVVISTAGIVYGLDVTTGDEIWNTDIQGWSPGNSEFDHLRVTEYHHGPSIVDQTVYVGTPARSLYALDLTSGDIHWDYDLPGLALAAPAIQNEKIVLPLYGRMDTADSTGVIAVTRTGEREWWNNDMRLGTGAPVIQNSTVVFGHVTGHRLYGVNIDTGELLWEVNLPNEAETNVIKYTAPIGVKDIVVIAGHLPDSYGSPTDQRAPALIAFDPTSGTKQWSYLYEKRSEDTALLQPATDGHLIYAGTSEGYLMAFDPDDGTLVWEHHPGSGAINGIAIADNTIVAVEGNYRNESAGRVLAFH